MTLGQRIAQKRKELGLSQEGLGEQLGISRQAIYKWESDSSLPEIDKLITLSKIFSVSVGWLLGVEEESQEEPREEAPSDELTEKQLKMVEEIVSRYLTVQPKPARHRWLIRLCIAAAALCLIVVLFNLSSKLDRMTQDYNNLYWSVNNISGNVNSQINSITSRVESVLKSQNDLTADWSAQLAFTDLRSNTATFDVRAVPKTYIEGMTAIFQAHTGDETVELPVEPEADHAFSGQITCPLSDQIDLSVVFITEDKRETQFLNDFYGLYSDTFPSLTLDNVLWFDEHDGVLLSQLPREQNLGGGTRIMYLGENSSIWGWNPEPPATIRVGLFRDRKLLTWYEGGVEPRNINGKTEEQYIWRRPEEITLEPGHTYSEAAVYTDKYGRQYIYEDHSLEYYAPEQSWQPARGIYTLSSDPADWEF